MMSLLTLLAQLHGGLSAQARILTDPDDEEFVQLCLRWSDIDRKVPGAIIVAGDETDVVKAVRIVFGELNTINIFYFQGQDSCGE